MHNQIQFYRDLSVAWLDREWKTPREKKLEKELQEVRQVLKKLQLCPDCGSPLHMHHLDDKLFHLECVACGFYSTEFYYPKWKAQRKYEFPQE